MHNIYGYGQLFCFSGMDGETSYTHDLVGMLMPGFATVRFHFRNAITLRLGITDTPKIKAVTGDMIDSDKCILLFKDRLTVVGKSLVKPEIFAEHKCIAAPFRGGKRLITTAGRFYLDCRKEGDWYYFCFSFGKAASLPTEIELDALAKSRYAYFAHLPKCEDKYMPLLSKCYSINKENVYSPEGKIPCTWTTPDRLPHHHMWLWDSAFHAMAFSKYNVDMAKKCILSVLSLQKKNGFIAHMMGPKGAMSRITQPQVLAWAAWEVYESCGDKQFLSEVAPAIGKFLLWTMQNRDKNHNGLLEWLTESNPKCHCGESGWDNSPRFDSEALMDAVDFSTFLAMDADYLAKIYGELGNKEQQKRFADIAKNTAKAINELLWDDENGMYYDRTMDGKLTYTASPASFLPMLAGVPTKKQAAALVKNLTDEAQFWAEVPVPTISKQHPTYNGDMWRGGTWLNVNYFVIKGLRRYGYNDIADTLKARTLAAINKWYKQSGNVFEFYDAENKTVPFMLKRKGEPIDPPDYRKHMHAITDFNWSACFTLLMLLENGNE